MLIENFEGKTSLYFRKSDLNLGNLNKSELETLEYLFEDHRDGFWKELISYEMLLELQIDLFKTAVKQILQTINTKEAFTLIREQYSRIFNILR